MRVAICLPAMGSWHDFETWQDGHTRWLCHTLMPLKAEVKIMQRGDGFERVNLTVLYARLLGFVMEASREFSIGNYINAHLCQNENVCGIFMLCSEQRGEGAISGVVSGGRGHTSAQGALYRSKPRTHNRVQLSNSVVRGAQVLCGEIRFHIVNRPHVSRFMAPRQRGVPRRGGVWGISRREEVQAREIPPLAMAAPPSSPSEESDEQDS